MLKTVFVVGAGASTEFHLGVGKHLAINVRELLQAKTSTPNSWDELGSFEDALRRLDASRDEIVRASETIRRGLPFSDSIDDFLFDNRENLLVVQLGKLAIAHCMLRQEQNAEPLIRLHDQTIDNRARAADELKSTWIDKLFRRLKRGHQGSEADSVLSAISFVVFNYDRCIEQYLFTAIADSMDLDAQAATHVAGSIQIEHVYGSLGPLPWQAPSDSIGFADTSATLGKVANGIKTYSEEISGTSHAIIAGMLRDAEQIVFLGYAFHEQGMNLLFPPEEKHPYMRAFWTNFGVHSAVASRAQARISQSTNSSSFHQYPLNSKCADAIEEWQFALVE